MLTEVTPIGPARADSRPDKDAGGIGLLSPMFQAAQHAGRHEEISRIIAPI
jgi:hypothetical protein